MRELDFDTGGEPEADVTRADLATFGRQLSDSLVDELDRRDAERERLEAERDRFAAPTPARTDEDSLRRTAAQFGVTPEQVLRAVEAGKREQLREDIRSCLAEVLPELMPGALEELVERDDSPRPARRASTRATSASGSGRPAPDPSASNDDTPPGLDHWAERRIGRRSSASR